jgi:hypothetical protein
VNSPHFEERACAEISERNSSKLCCELPIEFRDVVFVRYLDHVAYSRTSALVMKPQVREAVGWLVYECEYYITITWDRDSGPPTIKGGDPKASGLVLLKSDVLELKRLRVEETLLQSNLSTHLNSELPTTNSEYAFRPTERKTQKSKEQNRCRH